MHFVDGGYYDNDGTASAIEFLRYALSESKLLAHPAAQKSSSRAKPAPPDTYVPLRVVLVEIRNSPDSAANGWLVPGTDQGKAWNVVSEIAAPLEAFWSAGHESVTSATATHSVCLRAHFTIGWSCSILLSMTGRRRESRSIACLPIHSSLTIR